MTKERTHKQYENMERFEDTYGVISIIFNQDGHVLAGTENIAKQKSGRESGQISLPMETLKPFERKNKLALSFASLSELVTSDNVGLIASGLYQVGVDGPLKLNDEGLLGAISIFVWKGDPECMPFSPSNPKEFSDFEWIDPQVFKTAKNARPYAIMGLDFAFERGYQYGSYCEPFFPINSLRPDQYNAIRNNQTDVG